MKVCPNCGAENDDNTLKCILCEFEFDVDSESQIEDKKTTEEAKARSNEVEKNSTVSLETNDINTKNNSFENKNQSKVSRKVMIAGLSLIIFAGGIVGGILFMKNKNYNKVSNSNQSTASAVTESTSLTAESTKNTTITETKATAVTETTTEACAQQNKIKEFPANDISNYPQYLEAIKESTTTYFYDPDNADYTLLDLNNDNVPELFLNGSNGCGLYCIDDNSSHSLFSSFGGNRPPGLSFTDKGYIIISYMPNAAGEGGTSYCTYEGGDELKNVYNIQYDLANETYQHDNTFLSKEEYLQEKAQFGEQITLNSTPVKSISEVKTQIDTQSIPTAEANIEEKCGYPIGDGSSFILNVTGNYAYYYYECYYTGGGSNDCLCTSGTTSEASVYITAGSVMRQVRAVVTPYNSEGVAGETINLSMTPKYSKAYSSQTITACTKYGEIYSPNGVLINGYTKAFIVDDSRDYSLIRNDLMDKWHITAVNYFIRCGTYWYELYDTDDGDYYGWVNENNIKFY